MTILTTIGAESWYEQPDARHGMVSLVPMTPHDLGRLEYWLAAPHLLRHWLPAGADLTPRILSARSDLALAMEESHRAPFMIRMDGSRLGYLELVHANAAPVLQALRLEPETIAIRLFMGNAADLGRGYGRRAIRLGIEAAFSDAGVKACLAMPSPANAAAIHVFMAVGFARGQVMITRNGAAVSLSFSRQSAV